jgi:hypothetical protein
MGDPVGDALTFAAAGDPEWCPELELVIGDPE